MDEMGHFKKKFHSWKAINWLYKNRFDIYFTLLSLIRSLKKIQDYFEAMNRTKNQLRIDLREWTYAHRKKKCVRAVIMTIKKK